MKNKGERTQVAGERHKIQPFIDWLIDSKKVSKNTTLYLDMEDYLKHLQASQVLKGN